MTERRITEEEWNKMLDEDLVVRVCSYEWKQDYYLVEYVFVEDGRFWMVTVPMTIGDGRTSAPSVQAVAVQPGTETVNTWLGHKMVRDWVSTDDDPPDPDREP